ncbi:MAG: YjfB family protein [Lachnospiraceae bacterium]|nr:YjfB family protein [Lachnospiraceae bacterium]
MDIASISMAMSQSSALTNVGTAMLSNAMDVNEALGQGMVNMIDAAAMERSVNPHIGSNFDMLV